MEKDFIATINKQTVKRTSIKKFETCVGQNIMEKVLLICYSPRRIAPFLETYMTFFNKLNIPFDFCTREIKGNHLDSKVEPNQFVFEYEQKKSIFSKIMTIKKWKRFVCNLLQKNNYSRLVLLTCYPSLILGKKVMKQYSNKYIVDIRDYFKYVENRLVFQYLKKIIDNSYFTAISSEGFLEWLPISSKYKTIHNMPSNCNLFGYKPIDLQLENVYSIGYFGVIHYYKENEKLISALANNPKFKLIYRGLYSEPEKMQNIVKTIGANNVEFYGEFPNSKKAEYYSSINFINAIYGNDSLIVRSALPNKLYDCVIYKKPIIVSCNTFLAEIVKRYNLGISLNIEADILDQINSYIESFDIKTFVEGANAFLKKSLSDNEEIMNLCHSLIAK